METGIELIARERERQMFKEGWSPSHDDKHTSGELATAGACYGALAASQSRCHIEGGKASAMLPPKLDHLYWPWEAEWWKPSDDKIRNLVKAGGAHRGGDRPAETRRRTEIQKSGAQRSDAPYLSCY